MEAFAISIPTIIPFQATQFNDMKTASILKVAVAATVTSAVETAKIIAEPVRKTAITDSRAPAEGRVVVAVMVAIVVNYDR